MKPIFTVITITHTMYFFTIIKNLHVIICIMHTRIQKYIFVIYLYCFQRWWNSYMFYIPDIQTYFLLFLFWYTDKWNSNIIHSETILKKHKPLERWYVRQIIQTSALKRETRGVQCVVCSPLGAMQTMQFQFKLEY